MLTPEELKIQREALEYATKHKVAITTELTNPERYAPEKHPVSVFMAGSPGAGKTEASLELLRAIAPASPIVIDPDEYRKQFPGYQGGNAYLFQGAVSAIVSRVMDLVLKQSQSFLLDGTLTNYDRANENIKRSLKRDREVHILYVYQEPLQAWQFVQAREALEGRRIPKESFINQYFEARNVVDKLKERHGKAIRVDLLVKNFQDGTRAYHANVDRVDHHIPERYTQNDIENMLAGN